MGIFGITLSVCSSVRVSDCVRSVSLEPLNLYYYYFFLTKLGMVVYYHLAMGHAEKLLHYLQCQGHSEGLYDQNVTIFFTRSLKLLVCLQPNLV